ncbi:SGNH/GDSL hydrolase family protein [Nakamurella deserti]|uniref:SGNH/GDSL hydrolase family protein n=1 Tax=Nakamurella deserti TaxID=2164074 RepID=UPI000DBE5817|nr:SGNH/GDSL hydrolase family protein [Nakamurella deserti]
MTFHRFVALGDSFTEGVGDPDDTRPNGVRGWADRVAEVLAARQDDLTYANLAIRGRKLGQIIAEQVEPAVALAPDLVTLYAGVNDVLRPRVDIDALVALYADGIRRLAATGARLVLFTAYDTGGPSASGIFAALRGRFAIYNELVREVADRHGATLVDFWRMRALDDPRMWDVDRLHLSPAGHQLVAIAVLDALGVAHDLQPLELAPAPVLSARDKRAADLVWARRHLAPWVKRRLTRSSSGDTLQPRRPVPSRLR